MRAVRVELSRTIGFLGALLVTALPFSTSPLTAAPTSNATVTLHDGLATVVSHDATATDILAAWARAGDTTIVNAERMSTERLSIELVDVPEKVALDTVLRSAAGYLAVERAILSSTASKYRRIVILASSSAPREPVRAAAPPPAFRVPPIELPPAVSGVQRLMGPDGQPVADDQEGAPPPNRRAAPPGYSSGDAPSGNQPATTPSTPAATRPPPGSPVPGMIVQPPQPQEQQPQDVPPTTR